MALQLDGFTSLSATAIATTTPITVVAWVKPENDAQTRVVWLGTNVAVTNYYGIYVGGAVGGDPFRLQIADGSASEQINTSTGFTLNTWHHIAGVFSTTTSRSIYIDGGSKTTGTTSVSPTGITDMYVGGASGVYLTAQIAELAVWNVALTDAEILQLSLGYSPLLLNHRLANLIQYNGFIIDNRGIGNTWTGSLTSTEHTRMIYPQQAGASLISPPVYPINNFSYFANSASKRPTVQVMIEGIPDILCNHLPADQKPVVKSIALDGTMGLETSEYIANQIFPNGDFSIGIYIRPDNLAITSDQPLFSFYDDGNNLGYELGITDAGYLYSIAGEGASREETNISFVEGDWYFVAFSAGGLNGTERLYIAIQLDSSGYQETEQNEQTSVSGDSKTDRQLYDYQSKIRIGWNSTDFFEGRIGHITLFDRALTLPELRRLAYRTLDNKWPIFKDCIAQWRIDEDTIADTGSGIRGATYPIPTIRDTGRTGVNLLFFCNGTEAAEPVVSSVAPYPVSYKNLINVINSTSQQLEPKEIKSSISTVNLTVLDRYDWFTNRLFNISLALRNRSGFVFLGNDDFLEDDYKLIHSGSILSIDPLTGPGYEVRIGDTKNFVKRAGFTLGKSILSGYMGAALTASFTYNDDDGSGKSRITRASGSFITDGYAPGQYLLISETVSNNIYVIITEIVSATAIRVSSTAGVAIVLTDEGPISSTITPVSFQVGALEQTFTCSFNDNDGASGYSSIEITSGEEWQKKGFLVGQQFTVDGSSLNDNDNHSVFGTSKPTYTVASFPTAAKMRIGVVQTTNTASRRFFKNDGSGDSALTGTNLNRFYAGQRIRITGSVSNNGDFTVKQVVGADRLRITGTFIDEGPVSSTIVSIPDLVDELSINATIRILPNSSLLNFSSSTIGKIGDSIDPSGYVKIDDEIIKYTDVVDSPMRGVLCERGLFNSTIAAHSINSQVDEILVFDSVHPIDVMLWLLLSNTGNEASSSWDSLAVFASNSNLTSTTGRGAGLSPSDIDIDGILEVKNKYFPDSTWNGTFIIDENVDDIKEYCEEQILKPLACFFLMNNNGKLSIGYWGKPATGIIRTIESSKLQRPQSTLGYVDIINAVIFRYDKNIIDSNFNKIVAYEDANSQLKHGRSSQLSIESDWIRSENPEGMTANYFSPDTITDNLKTVYFDRFSNPLYYVEVSVGWEWESLNIGDIVKLQSIQLPDFDNGFRGIQGENFMIMSRELGIRSSRIILRLVKI